MKNKHQEAIADLSSQLASVRQDLADYRRNFQIVQQQLKDRVAASAEADASTARALDGLRAKCDQLTGENFTFKAENSTLKIQLETARKIITEQCRRQFGF